MSDLSIKKNASVKSNPTFYDAGEKLKGAVDSILTNDSNDSINSNISRLEGDLKRNGVRNTKFVGQLLYSFRGVQQGVPGDLKKFKQAVQMAQSSGALGPRGASSLLAKVGAQVPKQESKADAQARVDNSILNVKNQPTPRKPFENLFENPLIKNTKYEYKKQDIFTPKQKTATKQTTQAKPEVKKQGEVSPALERAITSLDVATKSMPSGVVKSSLEAVHSSLELAKEAQLKGDTASYTRAIANLGSKTFELVGTLVKQFGQNPELATQAAGQLGKIAGVLGKVAGPIKALEAASKVFTGKTLGGTPVDKNARADAAIDLVSSALPPPVQAAIAITKAEIEALYNHVGVPVHRAIEEYGLKRLFGGKTPDQLKTTLDALPTDEANANATVRKLLSFFPNTTSGMSQATANDLWRKFMSKEMAGDAEYLKMMVNQDPKKPNQVPDMLREVIADRMKSAAKRFVDLQVREARGNW